MHVLQLNSTTYMFYMKHLFIFPKREVVSNALLTTFKSQYRVKIIASYDDQT